MEENKEESMIDKLKKSLSNLNGKKSKIYFFLPPVKEPNSSVYEIYFHAKTLQNEGFEVTLIVESEEYKKPFFVDKELVEDVMYEVMETASRITLTPEDILVIPESLTNVMEQTKTAPSIRIVLHQSLDYMYNSLVLMSGYPSHGVVNVITNSEDMKEYLKKTIGGSMMDIKTYNIGIPDYFKPSEKPKQPSICFLTRNANDITKIAKDFYTKNPMYSFVTFEAMYSDSKPPRQLTRKEFADKLSKSFASVWIDRISSFGTFPLESMKSGTIPVSLIPDFTPPFMFDDNGIPIKNAGLWTNSTYELSDLLSKLVSMYLDDSIPNDIYDTMKQVSDKYSVENSRKTILESYNYFINKRSTSLTNAIDKLEKSEKETV